MSPGKQSFSQVRLSERVIYCSLFILVSAVVYAQDKRTLRETLRVVERRYAVSFTYADENVEGIFIEQFPVDASLSEVLTFLTRKTGLLFTRLDERFIAISKPVTAKQLISICGAIVDQETNEKIGGATIQSGNKFSVSDANGYFELQDLDEGSMLTIRSLGHELLTLDSRVLQNRPCSTLRLKLSTYYLSEVMIPNYLTTGIRKRADGSLSIQTRELGILPGLTEPDVLITIQALPGIQSINETVSNINVRGGTHDQNLVLWDGMRMYQQGHFFGLISAFNPYLTHDVILVKNGTSAQYSDGVSSTIDIRSDDEVSRTFTGGAGVNMIDFDLLAKIPLSSKSSIHISGRRSIADLVETPTYRSYYDRAFRDTDVTSNVDLSDSVNTGEQFYFYDFSAKYLHDISSKDKLRINFLTIKNRINYEETENLSNLTESKTSSLDQQNMAAGISYSRLWNSSFRTSGQWYFSKYDLNAVNFDIPNDQRVVQGNEVEDMGLKLDAHIRMSERVDLLGGYQFFEVGITNLEDVNNPTYYRKKKDVLRTHVIFADAGYTSASGNTNIIAGLRANYFSKFEVIRLEPRLSINQKVSKSLSVEILGEMKSQSTTQIIDFQNDFLGVEKRRWVMANDEAIPVITSSQVSLGLHHHNNNFLVSLEGYGKWVDDIITSSQGFQNQFQYVHSIGSYRSTGIDFLVNWRISKINTWLSYSLGRNTYTFSELVPPSFPSNLDIRHRATGGVSYQSAHIDISCGVNWRTGKPYTEPSGENSITDGEINYQSPNSSTLGTYWRVDLSANYKFQLSSKIRGIVGFSIWNLFNHDNVIDAYYQLDEANQIMFSQQKALGFTPNAMFRVEF